MSDEHFTYDDDLGAIEGRENLWRTVLMTAVKEALTGEGVTGTLVQRIRQIESARRYISDYGRDFREVCSLAGLDPEAVHDAVTRQLETAPTPKHLAKTPRDNRGTRKAEITGDSYDHAA